jgi:FHA domain
MLTAGRSRQRLAGILNSAFAEGLLSEQTHAHRLGLLFAPRLIDEHKLVGDLRLRRAGSRPGERVRVALAALIESARTLTRSGGSHPTPLLLALDWSESDRLLLGREPRCDVVVANPTVSRRHAQLTFRDGSWVIQDLAATNGTSVNGVPVGRMALRAGDVVTLGSQSIQID